MATPCNDSDVNAAAEVTDMAVTTAASALSTTIALPAESNVAEATVQHMEGLPAAGTFPKQQLVQGLFI